MYEKKYYRKYDNSFLISYRDQKKKNASEHSSAGKFQHLSKMVENKTGMVVLGLQ